MRPGFTLEEGMAMSACVYWLGYFVGVWNERRLATRAARSTQAGDDT